MPADTSFIEGVRQIAAVQNQVYRHTDFDTLEADRLRRERWGAPADALYESIALTYQPFPMRMQDDHLNQIEYRSIWHDNGTAVQPLYLTVMHRPLGTGMDFYFKYQAAVSYTHLMNFTSLFFLFPIDKTKERAYNAAKVACH